MASRPRITKRRETKRKALGADNDAPSQLFIENQYTNELPKPPVPKILRALPPAERLYRYTTTTLELEHRPILLWEKDPLARIELVDRDAYGELAAAGSMPPPLPPQDASLLNDDDLPASKQEVERKKRKVLEATEAWHREAFPLQQPQLVTNDIFTERQRFTTGLAAAEKKLYREAPPKLSTEDLIDLIELTFENAQAPPVHPSNPKLKPKRMLPIVPDAVLWANRYRQVLLDKAPPDITPGFNDVLFKVVPDPRTVCFGYFAPAGEEGGPDSYRLAQNYVWENRGNFGRSVDINEGETLLLSVPMDDNTAGEVRFVAVPQRMKLCKQKASRLDLKMPTEALSVSHREPSAQEAQEEQERMNVVLSDEVQTAGSTELKFINGEWQLAQPGSIRTGSRRDSHSRGASSDAGTETHPLPIATG